MNPINIEYLGLVSNVIYRSQNYVIFIS